MRLILGRRVGGWWLGGSFGPSRRRGRRSRSGRPIVRVNAAGCVGPLVTAVIVTYVVIQAFTFWFVTVPVAVLLVAGAAWYLHRPSRVYQVPMPPPPTTTHGGTPSAPRQR